MTGIKKFDLLNSPLAGTNLIAASAGTGKTYTITGIFLRLLIEKDIPIDRILVVTFTEAAAQELKDRIRSKLRETVEVFSGGHGKDEFLNSLVARNSQSKDAQRCLKEALRNFDEAAIFTIHGFCGRTLHENAFESASFFETELVVDLKNLKQEIVEDFWRKHFYESSPLFVNYATKIIDPGRLLNLTVYRVLHPDLKVIPRPDISDTDEHEKQFKAAFEAVNKAWPAARPDIKNILLTHNGLSRSRYQKEAVLFWIHQMDDLMDWGENQPALFDKFDKFTASEIEKSMKRNFSVPEHPFFCLCETLKRAQEKLRKVFEKRILGLKVKLFDYSGEELRRRKQAKNIQSFDDLLYNLYHALIKEDGSGLSQNIRSKFDAALIDEFQDTDPIQYEIFRKVFDNGKSLLFLIGDPKQAIYGFRGADIFAYMEAARHSRFRYTLRENWRSEPRLISAINTVFGNSENPFIFNEIGYEKADAPDGKKEQQLFQLEGSAEAPLQLWFLNPSGITEAGKSIGKQPAREWITRSVAEEISRLLDLGAAGKAMLGDRALGKSDIAVLVRRNVEARMMQEALSTLFNIPSVLHSTGNLFASREALEMERILSAVSQPNNETYIKAALSSEMLGISGETLNGLIEDETAWEDQLIKFGEYYSQWNQSGFIRMFKHMMVKEKILARLMRLPDGERRSTNLLHLSEVLHQVSIEKKLGMAGLIKWLSDQRHTDSGDFVEQPLRLESDEDAVKLVTVHKSKGLEYPVVFCPFMWDGARGRNPKTPCLFHDTSENLRLTLDLGSEDLDANRCLAEKELLAENLRLLYVALTRAKNRCYVVWGRINEAGTSALAYLLHPPRFKENEDVLSATEARFNYMSDEDMIKELRILQDKARGTVRLSEIAAPSEEPVNPYSSPGGREQSLDRRKFSGNIDQDFKICSFSSLVFSRPHGAELADRDAAGMSDPEKRLDEPDLRKPASDIFLFPGGTKSGTLLHDIFEHLDFKQKETCAVKKLLEDKLKEYGFEPFWTETLFRMIQQVLSVPLIPDRNDFTLSRIDNKDRINELEFYFPLKPTSSETLGRIFAKYGGPDLPPDFPENIERLSFAPVKGFMKGFMDLVFRFEDRFYLVDWKSNFLGGTVADYHQNALKRAMKENYYFLQYHIYVVALNQYLRLRVPGYGYEKNFGEVYYLFLRGIDSASGPDYGVFRHRPSGKLINRLSLKLIPSV
jgi:exodeoxyribonuclease V beta subunit